MPIHLFIFLELSMPPAGQNLFVKRFQHLQKLLFKALWAYFFLNFVYLRVPSRLKLELPVAKPVPPVPRRPQITDFFIN